MNQTKTRRGITLLLGVLMILGMTALSGCGQQETGSKVSSALPQSSSQEEKPSSTGGESSVGSSVSAKTITLEVVHKDKSKNTFTISTEAETLREALEQEKLAEGEDSSYGMFVKTVDGETVDDGNQEWWCLTKGGEMWNYGVDDTKISDGDAFEFTFTEGY